MQDNQPHRPTNYEAFLEAFEEMLNEYLVLQRRFLNLPSSWSEIAPREERPQGWQAREQVAMEMCSRSFYCEPSL